MLTRQPVPENQPLTVHRLQSQLQLCHKTNENNERRGETGSDHVRFAEGVFFLVRAIIWEYSQVSELWS